MTTSERRSSPRAQSRVPMVVKDRTREVKVETLNISKSGAQCRLSYFIPLMTKLEIRLELPGHATPQPTIHCRGVIVRVEPASEQPHRASYDTAIFFHDLSEPDRAILAEYVSQRL